MPDRQLTAIANQSFAGAFMLGTVNAGFTLIASAEQTGGFGSPAPEGNRHLLGDTWGPTEIGIENWRPQKTDLVFGNPPCSGFSGLTNRQDSTTYGDYQDRASSAINACMRDLVQHASACDPDVVVFESVTMAYTRGRSMMRGLLDILGPDYTLYHALHNSLSLGGCAMRKRYFFVASRVPFGATPGFGPPRTLRSAIEDLEPIPLGAFPGHVVDTAPFVTRIADLASGRVPGDGGNIGGATPERLAELARTGWAQGEAITRHGTSAERWRYDAPALVITREFLRKTCHPVLPRAFTHREAARIMGFPDSWSCQPAIDARGAGVGWWGKQLPVPSAQWIATAARESILGRPGPLTGEVISSDGRERLIDVTHHWRPAK